MLHCPELQAFRLKETIYKKGKAERPKSIYMLWKPMLEGSCLQVFRSFKVMFFPVHPAEGHLSLSEYREPISAGLSICMKLGLHAESSHVSQAAGEV